MQTHSLPLFILLPLPLFSVFGANETEDKGSWPQWRGPDRDGL